MSYLNQTASDLASTLAPLSSLATPFIRAWQVTRPHRIIVLGLIYGVALFLWRNRAPIARFAGKSAAQTAFYSRKFQAEVTPAIAKVEARLTALKALPTAVSAPTEDLELDTLIPTVTLPTVIPVSDPICALTDDQLRSLLVTAKVKGTALCKKRQTLERKVREAGLV